MQPLVEAAVLLVVVDEHNEVAFPKAIFKTDDVVVMNASQQVYLGLALVSETGILCISTLVLQLLHDHRPGLIRQLNSVKY